MRLVALIAPLLLAACATEPEAASSGTTASATGREEKIVCGMEQPTGSRLPVRRCWTHEQLDQESSDAKKVIERGQLIRPTPQAPGSGR